MTVSELASPKDPDENSTLRRLCILFSLKDACMRGIRQPIDFDVVNSKAQVDSLPLVGWEFWVFKANLGVARGSKIAHDQYKCVCAFYRGPNAETKFVWHQTPRELESWVQFINIVQMVKVFPKLTA
jgi:4'-phosphopantetheinyl transferase